MSYKKKGYSKGNNHKDAKLNEQKVREIRGRKNELQKVLAIDYGVDISTIHSVLNRKTWKHI